MGATSPVPNPVGGKTLYRDLYSALEVVGFEPAVWQVAATLRLSHWNGRVAGARYVSGAVRVAVESARSKSVRVPRYREHALRGLWWQSGLDKA